MKLEFSREEYTVRIKWLIWSRVVLVSFLAGTLLFFRKYYGIFSFPTAALYYVLLSVYLLTACYSYLLRRIENLDILAYLQTSADIILVTYLVYLTGGIDSGLSVLYHLTIISASIILYRRGGYLSASFSSILYGAMLDMQYYNVPGFVRSHNFTSVQVLYQVFISILSFYIMALLSGYLAERLRKTGQELRAKKIDFDDLRVLQEHILRGVGSGILTMGLQGNIASWNPAAEQITGYRYEEIIHCWSQVFGDSIKGIFGHTDSLKERPFRFNGQIIKKDGSTAILGMTASLLRDDSNTIRGIILIFQDITKMVEMEEQVRRQERLALVGSLAAGIAHEIRNPLASLSGSIQVLQGELELKGDNKNLMEIVVKETDRLNTIITEFLDYARPRTAQNEQIDLVAVLDETIMLLKNSRDFHESIRIRHTVQPQLIIRGDAQQVRQVFWNLLINACQAMPNGGDLTITAVPLSSVADDALWCEIIVADSGDGIPREDIGKIFDPFFTTKTRGTGLGLAIVYRIINDHGGSVAVASEKARGTQFTIRLPMIEESQYSFTARSGEHSSNRSA